jgi:hypothetical protein
VLCACEIRLACHPSGDRRKKYLAWRPRDPNLRNGQQLGSNISFPSLFFGVPGGSFALRYTSSLWGLCKHWDGAFFLTAASQPRGHIFSSIASWSSIHLPDFTLAHRVQILHSVWHDTACFFRLRLLLLFDFYYLHLTTWPVRAHHLYLPWGMRPMTLVVAVPYMEDMKMLSLDNNNTNNSMSSCPTLVIH